MRSTPKQGFNSSSSNRGLHSIVWLVARLRGWCVQTQLVATGSDRAVGWPRCPGHVQSHCC